MFLLGIAVGLALGSIEVKNKEAIKLLIAGLIAVYWLFNGIWIVSQGGTP